MNLNDCLNKLSYPNNSTVLIENLNNERVFITFDDIHNITDAKENDEVIYCFDCEWMKYINIKMLTVKQWSEFVVKLKDVGVATFSNGKWSELKTVICYEME